MHAPPLASSPGFDLISVFSVELLFLGVALFAAIGALSSEEERPYSAALVYLGLGVVAALGVHAFGVDWLDPFEDATFFDHLTEVALVVALFASGLRVRRGLSWPEWSSVVLLLVVAMPLTIAAVAAFGVAAMGLPLGVAIVLGGALAPTDPVLAGGVGLAAPGEERAGHGARFTLTAEASANDALAAPFVLLGFFVVQQGGAGWTLEWLLADVVYAIVLAAAVGGAAGWLMGRFAAAMRERDMLSRELDGFLVIGIVLLVYGAVDTLDGYGFLAVFAAGIGFRRYEADREYNRRAHDGAQVAQNFLELAVILLLGSLLTLDALAAPGVAGWLLAPLLVLVIRPAVVALALSRAAMPAREKAFIGIFGVKGVASVHYVAVALAEGVLDGSQAVTVFWTVAIGVMLSILGHGVVADAFTRRLLPR